MASSLTTDPMSRADWTAAGRSFRQGTLLAVPLDGLLAGKPRPQVLFEPTERVSLAGVG